MPNTNRMELMELEELEELEVTQDPAEDEDECTRLGLAPYWTARVGSRVIWHGMAPNLETATAAAAAAENSDRGGE